MDETYGTYVDDERFDIHDYDDDSDHGTDDDTDDDTDDVTNDATDDDTDDGRCGNLYTTKVLIEVNPSPGHGVWAFSHFWSCRIRVLSIRRLRGSARSLCFRLQSNC